MWLDISPITSLCVYISIGTADTQVCHLAENRPHDIINLPLVSLIFFLGIHQQLGNI